MQFSLLYIFFSCFLFFPHAACHYVCNLCKQHSAGFSRSLFLSYDFTISLSLCVASSDLCSMLPAIFSFFLIFVECTF